MFWPLALLIVDNGLFWPLALLEVLQGPTVLAVGVMRALGHGSFNQ